MMKTTLCTLFNSLYLDKGLVLFDSLKECASNFELYVLCMDDKCYQVLSSIDDTRLIPITLQNVENESMLEAKTNRGTAEYCWTCTSRLIQYILETYSPECCTYIDADMYFYKDPQILIDDMIDVGKSVLIVPHRYAPNHEKKYLHIVGKYCVEFNCFKNDKAGLEVLNHWHTRCLDCCSNLGDGIHWGDQKYLDEWPTLFSDSVHECEHPGAGIAPWNIELYRNFDKTDFSVIYKRSNKKVSAVFFHYQGVRYLSRKKIAVGVMSNNTEIDYNLVKGFYIDYLTKIEETKKVLESQYNLDFLLTSHPTIKQKRMRTLIKRSTFARAIWHKINKSPESYIVTI